MTESHSKAFIKYIAVYIIFINLFEVLYRTAQYLSVSNDFSNAMIYLVAIVFALLSILLLRVLFQSRDKISFFILILLTAVIYFGTFYITSYLGEMIGENFEVTSDKYFLFEKLRNYLIVGLHILLIAIHPFILGDKKVHNN